jgi:prepilin-type N-terminal cleavage/methylation domain-containing protein
MNSCVTRSSSLTSRRISRRGFSLVELLLSIFILAIGIITIFAGPDSHFGRLQDDIDDQDYADAQDNIYSYEPAQP